MPEAFNKCRKAGGKIVTKKLDGGKYMHICYDKQGKAHPGEVKKAKADDEDSKQLVDELRKLQKELK